MDYPNRLEAKGLARAKIRARRRRVRAIRRRTARSALALFAVVWTIVFAQLASGNDPALSRPPAADRRHAPPKVVPEEEFAPEVEVEAVEVEPEPAPEPEPIVTSAS